MAIDLETKLIIGSGIPLLDQQNEIGLCPVIVKYDEDKYAALNNPLRDYFLQKEMYATPFFNEYDLNVSVNETIFLLDNPIILSESFKFPPIIETEGEFASLDLFFFYFNRNVKTRFKDKSPFEVGVYCKTEYENKGVEMRIVEGDEIRQRIYPNLFEQTIEMIEKEIKQLKSHGEFTIDKNSFSKGNRLVYFAGYIDRPEYIERALDYHGLVVLKGPYPEVYVDVLKAAFYSLNGLSLDDDPDSDSAIEFYKNRSLKLLESI